MRKLLAALFAALLLLGACGGSDDGDDSASDTTEDESSDSNDSNDSNDSDDSSSDGDDTDLGDLDGCAAASGAVLTLGFMPLAFAFAGMGEAFTDDTLFTEADVDEMQTAIDDLQDAVPDELTDDVETLGEMSTEAFEDPESFDEAEWEKSMEGITTYLEDECGGAFDDLENELGDLGDLEGDLEDLSDMSIPDFTIPE